jgi:hypothetical protein
MEMDHLVLPVLLVHLARLDRLAAILEKAKAIVLLMNETAMVSLDIGRLKKLGISGLIWMTMSPSNRLAMPLITRMLTSLLIK